MREGITAPDTWRQEELLRRKRRRAIQYRRRRIRFGLGFVIFCLLVLAVVLLTTGKSSSSSRVDANSLLAGSSPAASAPVKAIGRERPAFARLGDRNLILPVAAGDATIIAYQPTSDEQAVPLTPIGERINTNALVRFFRSIFAGEPLVCYYQLNGGGASRTGSVIIGAHPGSLVTSPVSGIVIGVKEYKLHGKYDDVRIDIRPEELSGATVSIMFISDPVVSIGEVVSAGKTQLGKVRECPTELGAAIARYTYDSGAHIHLKVTEEPVD